MERSGILSPRIKSMRKFNVHYAWIYLTERCNLNCEYCYFQHRQGRDVSPEAVQRFFQLLDQERAVPSTLIVSGGEVFLAQDRLWKVLEQARRHCPDTSLHVQTNGILIGAESVTRLRRSGVSLEFGIDGGCQQTMRRRRGMTPEIFQRLTDNIRACVKAGISCGCTMAVHPEEVRHMSEGVDFLCRLGLSRIDVTPAAFMPWTRKSVRYFKKTYLSLARQVRFRNVFYARDDADWIAPGTMDLSLHPPGYLLAGDPFLCLAEKQRAEFSLWDPASGSVKPEILSFYQDAYHHMYREKDRVPYRAYVCHSFDVVNSMMEKDYINSREINDIMRFLTRVHTALNFRILGGGDEVRAAGEFNR